MSKIHNTQLRKLRQFFRDKGMSVKIKDMANYAKEKYGIFSKDKWKSCYLLYEKMLEDGVLGKLRKKRLKPVTDSFYKSREWLELRYRALQIYGRKCACCGAIPSNGVVLHVDHIKPKSKFPELRLRIDNLQILWSDCNIGKSNKDDTDFR